MLWEVLRLSGRPSKFIKLVRLFHDGKEAGVKVDNLKSDSFEVSQEVKPGYVLAPVLFNDYIRYITRLLSGSVGRDCGACLK